MTVTLTQDARACESQLINLHRSKKYRKLAIYFGVFKGAYAVPSVALSLFLSGCTTDKIPSTQVLEPADLMVAIVHIAEHGDLSDSAYTGDVLGFILNTEGKKNETLMNGVKVTRQEYKIKFRSDNYSGNYFGYATAKPDEETMVRTQFGISLQIKRSRIGVYAIICWKKWCGRQHVF